MTKLFRPLILLIVLATFLLVRDFNSPYQRSIMGDGKGYYAYLPALFIYHDLDYGFTEEMEAKYYPADGSFIKDFRNKQANGASVNKYFPGLSILYLPFFGLAVLFSWIFGFPVDGYSAPFQAAVGISHVFYYFAGWWFLAKFLKQFVRHDITIWLAVIGLTFGTNVWYYLIYDHSVSHIHNFFLACIFIWLTQRFITEKQWKWFGTMGIILALAIIVRPTNAMMVLFIPFLFSLNHVRISDFVSQAGGVNKFWKYLPLALLILMIPPLLWKMQSGLWLVYSYNEEGFDFLHPNWWNYLFSYQKGWLLWTPLMVLFIVVSAVWSFRKSRYTGLFFLLPVLVITYVLSSWWCWTYGAGLGQRTMIEYYPFLIIGAALWIDQLRKPHFFMLILVPFIGLNVLQSYQVFHGILDGGTTTSTQYWAHFGQWKTTAPAVEIPANWKSKAKYVHKEKYSLSRQTPFSGAIETDSIFHGQKAVISCEIGGPHGNTDLRLVITNQDGSFYKDYFPGSYIYDAPRIIQAVFDLPDTLPQKLKVYVWNGDSETPAEVNKLVLECYEVK